VNGEFVQNVNNVNNQWAAFVQRETGNAVVKAGISDVANGKLDNQFFLAASIDGI